MTSLAAAPRTTRGGDLVAHDAELQGDHDLAFVVRLREGLILETKHGMFKDMYGGRVAMIPRHVHWRHHGHEPQREGAYVLLLPHAADQYYRDIFAYVFSQADIKLTWLPRRPR